MIQRIQSLYLFITAVLTGVMLVLPLAEVIAPDGLLKLTGFGFSDAAGVTVVSAYGLAAVVIVAALLALVSIFLFKNRLLQLRLSIVELILLVGIIVFEVYYIWGGVSSIESAGGKANLLVGIAAFFPLISIIFTLLAVRGIKKDITLVRSLDRIR